tara:strand:- start:2329 stop:2541 length:213 start_codon:yes stop_codon:yes gene_type:complete
VKVSRAFYLLKFLIMDLFIKAENESGEIEFHRINQGQLYIEIQASFGGFHYILTQEEVKALVSYIEYTNE